MNNHPYRATHARSDTIYVVASRRGWLQLVGKDWSHDENNPAGLLDDRERLLLDLNKSRSLLSVTIGHEFLGKWSDSDQRRLFCAVRNQPYLLRLKVTGSRSSPETIKTDILLESLIHIQSDRLQKLMISNVELRCRSEVLQMATALVTRSASLQEISLKGLVSTVADKERGFLDPILFAMATAPEGSPRAQPSRFVLEGCSDITTNDPSLITVEALSSYLSADIAVSGRGSRVLFLDGWGLGDEHARVLVGLAGESLSKLSLKSNPAIGKDGYESLIGLLNRNHRLEEIRVDDARWQAKLNLVICMNRKYGRSAFMDDCGFSCKAKWVDLLAKLADSSSPEHAEQEEERRVNYLWYSLLEKPDFFSS